MTNKRKRKTPRLTWMLSQHLDVGKCIEVDVDGKVSERTVLLYDGAVVVEKTKNGYVLV